MVDADTNVCHWLDALFAWMHNSLSQGNILTHWSLENVHLHIQFKFIYMEAANMIKIRGPFDYLSAS